MSRPPLNDYIPGADNPEEWFRRGISCMEKGDYPEAELCFRRTQSLAPESPETILNLGYALDKQGRSGEAFACYESVLALAADNVKARYNRSIHLLRAGNLAAGFADYETRFAAIKNADSRIYAQPRWDGSSLNGRSILIYCEQGLGDAIQFSRYIPLVTRLGGSVVLEVQQPLVSLLSTLSGVERVIAKSGVPPVTDCHIPLLSLPHVFETTLDTVPAPIPYLVPDPSKVAAWRQMLSEDKKFRVGLVWRGSESNPMDRDRSCPLAEIAPLLAISGVSCYSLQVGPAADEVPRDGRLTDLTGHLHDFSDTAALLANLDLVITVDTAVAHLVGALGRPVWILLANTPDWRWMLGRNDSPWYPAARLFRQPKPGDWQSVVSEIAQTLRQQLPQQEHEEAALSERQEASFKKGLASIENDDPDSALPELNNLLLQLPDDPSVLFNLGRAYDSAGQLVKAEQAYRQALLDSPDSPAIWFALGEIRLKQKAYPEAEFCLRKAHGLKPESVEILLNLGSALSAQQKNAAAFDTCQKILAIKPDCVEAVYNMAFIQLRNGDYRNGFANFEARLAVGKFNIDPRRYRQPRWDGSPLNGRSILIYGEQGMGDVIQFARYIPLVAERGGTVVFEVDPPLIPLFESFPGVDRVVPCSQIPPLTDVYIQLLSLPHIFGT
ncbi:MAG: tetratricopeptide repeat protein, partial [Desulfuromonadaceae bacterium]|nr:tetratricopeptide repeat protein [Desulfuromonadaceae bacterium]